MLMLAVTLMVIAAPVYGQRVRFGASGGGPMPPTTATPGNDHDAFGPTVNQRLSPATSVNDNFTDHADNRAAGPAGI